MNVPVVKTPLSIIALFVFLIEAFLVIPVSQLGHPESLILVIFMTAFPFVVAIAFFVLIWHKPIHLYSPQEITPGLEPLYQADLAKRVAFEVRIDELGRELQELRQRILPTGAALLPPAAASRLADEVTPSLPSTVEDLIAEVRDQILPTEADLEAAVAAAKREIERTRREITREKVERVQEEMSRFREWLQRQGFQSLPELPEIVMEPPTYLNAHYVHDENAAHFGARIAEDRDVIAHIYFHIVLEKNFMQVPQLLVEGLCDYYACAYTGDPYLGTSFAKEAGVQAGWLRNLEEVVSVDGAESDTFRLGLVWSGACWEARKQYGGDQIDAAVRRCLDKLTPELTMSQAAHTLADEVLELGGKEVQDGVREVFRKRGVQIGP